MSYIGQTGRNLKQRYREIYVTSGIMTSNLPTHNIYYKIYMYTDLLDTMSLLKPINKTSMLIP
jgi:hypothetical protein